MQSVSTLDKILSKRLLTHILFWIGVFVLYTQVFFNAGVSFWFGFMMNIVLFPSMIGTAYFLNYYQIPRLYERKKYLIFTFSLVLSTYLFTALARILTIYIAEPVLGLDQPLPDMWAIVLLTPERLIKNYVMSIYIAPLIMLSIKMLKSNAEAKRNTEQLEKEKHLAEINFLKAQIHPHFLFNTLNNLYSLTLQKSDEAPKTVVKLSEMLDYMLYQCNDKKVTIQKEIQLINNYIDLERLRYGDRLDLQFNESIDSPEIQVAPLILLSLIENAFKHGVSGAIQAPFILIDLDVNSEKLMLSVKNSKALQSQEDPTSYKSGIGFSNVKRQLDLIYSDKYELEINDQPETYHVSLSIVLK